jgi:hypothetical protein
MKNETPANTSQDYDRKHGQDHAAKNPRVSKGELTKDEIKSYPKQDKREIAREEHTHFTNRTD